MASLYSDIILTPCQQLYYISYTDMASIGAVILIAYGEAYLLGMDIPAYGRADDRCGELL